jgi:nicotine blue oxidoreductase
VSGPVSAVVLAAGEASRFGSPKQLLLLPAVLDRLSPLLRDGTLTEIVVVEGAHPLTPESAAGARIVRCEDWMRGPGVSLRCGLEALASDVVAAVVALADGPAISPEAVRRVLAAASRSGGDIVAASYDGVRGHPLVLARAAFERVPDEGLRALPAELVPCDDLGFPGDVDTPSDLPPAR